MRRQSLDTRAELNIGNQGSRIARFIASHHYRRILRASYFPKCHFDLTGLDPVAT
jgi:hypothetical protein